MRLLLSLVPKSLQARFLIALVLIGVLPISLAGIAVLSIYRSSVAEQSLLELNSLVRGLNSEVDNYIANCLEESNAIAAQPDIIKMDALAANRQLQAFYLTLSHLKRLDLLDMQGKPIASSHLDAPPDTLVDDAFMAALSGRQTWQTVPLVGEGTFNFVITTPIRDAERKVVGVLRAMINLVDLEEAITRTKDGTQIRALLVDKAGHVLIHPDVKTMQNPAAYTWPGQPRIDPSGQGSIWYDWDGRAYVAAYTIIQDVGWTVIVERPEQEVLAPVYQSRLITGIFVLLSILSATIVAVLISRALTKPLVQLGTAAHALGDGNMDAPLPHLPGNTSEIATLITSFSDMRTAVDVALSSARNEKALNAAILASVPTGLVVMSKTLTVLSMNDVAKVFFEDKIGEQPNASPVGVTIGALISENFRVASCNPEFATLFGLDPGTITDLRLADILPVALPGSLAKALTADSASPSAFVEWDTRQMLLYVMFSTIMPTTPDEDVKLLLAIEDVSEVTQWKARYRALEMMQRVSQTILRADDPKETQSRLSTMLNQVLADVMQFGPFDTGAIWLIDANSAGTRLYAQAGYSDAEAITPLAANLTILNQSTSQRLDDMDPAAGQTPPHLRAAGITHLYSMTIQTHDEVLGLIELGKRGEQSPSSFTNEFLTAAGNQLGRAVQRARLDEALARSEAETRLLSLVASKTTNAVIIADGHHQVEWVNAGFTAMTGYTLAEVLGKQPGALLRGPETDTAMTAYMYNQLAQGKGFKGEFVNYHKNGAKFWVHLEVMPIKDDDGRITRFISVENDVSERKAYEMALARARDEAIESARMKSDFLAMMSHEIRTPMNGILGMSELLGLTTLDDEQRDDLRIIRTEGEMLLGIINDILDFSKIEAGRIVLDPVLFKPAELLQSVMDMMQLRVNQRGLLMNGAIMEGTPERLYGDLARIRQIIINMLGNAVKFTSQGRIDIRISALNASPHGKMATIRFEVRDSGIGMSETVKNRLFKPFVQGDSSITRKYGGTGLGLAICKRLVEIMGGKIGVQSAEGAGSVFWFELPLERVDRTPASGTMLTDAFHNLHALLVLGDAAQESTLRACLTAWGAQSTSCNTAADAVAALSQSAAAGKPIDVVFVNDNLPWLDAITAPFVLVRESGTPRPGFILITDAFQSDRSAALTREGYAHFLDCPLHQSEIYSCLLTLLLSRQKGDDDENDTLQQPAPQAIIPLQKPRFALLLAEDNEVNQRVALAMLAKLGYTAKLAQNGQEAVDAVTSGAHYDLVFMDVQMPLLDGLNATQAIRAWEQSSATASHTPIVALTAHALSGDADACIKAGMDDYLSKPLSLKQLQTMLEKWLP